MFDVSHLPDDVQNMPVTSDDAWSMPVTIAVASGKGGTGKTLVATNLALVAARSGASVALVDCDADAPNAALFLRPAHIRSEVVAVPTPAIDSDVCVLCGTCKNACSFGALRILGGHVMVFSELCHNCGACRAVCPKGAIRETAERVGVVECGAITSISTTPGEVDVVTGVLDIGNVKAPAVIRAARARGEKLDRDVTILDAPPGVACPAVAAIHGADALVLVTEPTPFGLHDLKLAVELGESLGMPIGVVINRVGSADADATIDHYCEARRLPVLARIPFSREIAVVYADGNILVDSYPKARVWFEKLWNMTDGLARGHSR